MAVTNIINSKIFPRGYFVIFGSEFTARFCFWALQSILVLYFTKKFFISDSLAYSNAASYEALTYAMTFLGGMLADRYLGALKALLTGMVFSFIGLLFLFSHQQQLAYAGLAILAVGMGFYIPTNSSIVDNLYDKKDPARDRGYFYLYIATNLGGILGPLTLGILAERYSFAFGFSVCAGLIVVFLAMYAMFQHKIDFITPADHLTKDLTITRIFFLVLMFFGLIAGSYFLIRADEITRYLLVLCGIGSIGWLLFRSRQEEEAFRKKIKLIVFFCIISLFFFAMEFQILNSVITFTRDFVNKNLLGFSIPVASFVSFEPFFVVMLVPAVNFLLEKVKLKNRQMTVANKFMISFLLLSLSFFVLGYAAKNYHDSIHPVSAMWIIFSMFFMAAGEVFLMPVLLSLVTKESPEKMKNSMVGFLYLCISFSSYLSGVIANITRHVSLNSIVGYQQTYFGVFVFLLCVSLFLFFLDKTPLRSK